MIKFYRKLITVLVILSIFAIIANVNAQDNDVLTKHLITIDKVQKLAFQIRENIWPGFNIRKV